MGEVSTQVPQEKKDLMKKDKDIFQFSGYENLIFYKATSDYKHDRIWKLS